MAAFPSSLQSLLASLADQTDPSRQTLLDLVTQAEIQLVDLEAWADYDHPRADSYGRRMVFHGGHFELMVMTWLPGDVSAIHDHGGAEWGAVQCFGEALHDLFHLDEMVLSSSGARPYIHGDIQFVDPALIHQMGNQSAQPFLSLHIYGSRQKRPLITTNARLFDLDEGTIQFTDGGVFHALPEDRILKRISGLKASDALVARQREFKRQRIQRMGQADTPQQNNSPGSTPLVDSLACPPSG